MATNTALWRKIRHRVLCAEPLCRECKRVDRLTPATCVDHIDNDPFNNLDENLQPLCHSCHSSKTGRDRGLARRDPFAAQPALQEIVLPDGFTF